MAKDPFYKKTDELIVEIFWYWLLFSLCDVPIKFQFHTCHETSAAMAFYEYNSKYNLNEVNDCSIHGVVLCEYFVFRQRVVYNDLFRSLP